MHMMNRLILSIAWLLFLLLLLFFAAGGIGQKEEEEGDDVSNMKSLLPITTSKKIYSNAIVVAAQDGNIHLVDADSRKILWSFSSGKPIYSSYQALPDHETDDADQAFDMSDFYIDLGDDWDLYAHGPGYEKSKLPLSVEELITSTPIISSKGGVLLGSKNSTVFIIDAKSGRIIYAFKSDDHFSSSIGVPKAENNPLMPWNGDKAEQFVYVTRKDYSLKYISHKTGKELWYLKFADIEASFRCQEAAGISFDEKLKSDTSLLSGCKGSNAVVYRIRDQSSLERLFGPDGLLNAHIGARIPSLPATEHAISLPFPEKLPEMYLLKETKRVPALPLGESQRMLGLPSGDANEAFNTVVPSEVFVWSHMWYLVVVVVLVACIVVLVSYLRTSVVGRSDNLNKQPDGLPKKKKIRRANNSKNSVENHPVDKTRRKKQLTISNLVNGDIDGRRIGNMLITNKEIAKGSNGTIVWEGKYDGRLVAVKRLVRSHHDVALKEVQNLIASDCHPNIVRLYGIEYDQDFVYLSLELCNCSLFDLIHSHLDTSQNQIQNLFTGKKVELWRANGYPSAQLLNIMRDIVSGVAHLHELGIIHRDLKPQNVLIIKQGSVRAKLSDMGISKRLPVDMSSLTHNSTGGGSSGWQAPEQLKHERQTRSVDLFTLGCLLFFCLTGGQHPFGDSYERDMNIVKNQKDLFLIENMPEAVHLITQLLNPSPSLRPKAVDVLHHPLFWDADLRLSFLRDASDRVELEDRESDSELLKALESSFPVALGCKWDEKMESAFINDIGRYRRYKFDSIRDLLRVIRNKLNHYRELSSEIRKILGQPPQGFNHYFSSRFPKLLIEVYKVICIYCGEEEFLSKYFRSKQT